MTTTITGLRLYQWGKESTRGTLVAATSKMAIGELVIDPLDAVHRPDLAKGFLHRYRGSETIIQRGTQFQLPESPIIYDQHHIWCSMGVLGGVTGQGANPYTWTFARSLTSDPIPDTRTLERRLTDGSTPKDQKWGYAFLSQMGWHYKIDQPVKFSASGYARRVQAATLTAGQALPTIEIPPTPLAGLFIDTSWAGLGGTAVSAQVLSADVVFKTGLKPKWTFDPTRSDLDYTSYVIDAKECGLDVTLRMLMAGQYDTEKTAAEAQTLRAVRLKVLGTTSRELTLDMLLKHDKGSLQKVGEEDGQDIVDMKLVDTDDGTNLFSVKVVNATNTLN